MPNPGKVLLFALLLSGTFAAATLADEDSHLLPPKAKPFNYSLLDMLTVLAPFDASFNDHYPKTPFRILFVGATDSSGMTCPNGLQGVLSTGTNAFTVKAGQDFFVPPLVYVDNSEPVLGTFPTTPSEAVDYFFGPAQNGGRHWRITVDGETTSVGPEYLAGPIRTSTITPINGGTAAIQLGVFLSALPVGNHTVKIRGEFDGAGMLTTYGVGCEAEDYEYTVKVVPKTHQN